MSVEASEAEDKLGFKPAGKLPGEIYIEKVFAKSWAEKMNLQVNDLLVEINGQKLSEITQADLDRLIKLRPLKLLFRRSQTSSTVASEKAVPVAKAQDF